MIEEKDVDGKWHYIDRQQKVNSCGPSCVKMIQKIINNQDLGEQYVRMIVADYEGAHDGNLGNGGPLIEGARDFQHAGTWNIRAGLDALRPKVAYETYSSGALTGPKVKTIANTWDSSSQILSLTNDHKPAITEVRWIGGGAHWVIVGGPLSNNRYLVLDPYYGVQYVRVNKGVFDQYQPRNAGTRIVNATANWAPNVVLIK